MGENNTVSAYERSLFELLLRHELPADCEIQVEVKSKGAKTASKAVFSLRGDAINVKADLDRLNLRRVVQPTCW